MLKEQIEPQESLKLFVNKADPKQVFLHKDFLAGFKEEERQILLNLCLVQNPAFYQLCTHDKNFINKTSLEDLNDLSYRLNFGFLENVKNSLELTESEKQQFRILPLSDWLMYLPDSSSKILIPKINRMQSGTPIPIIETGLIPYLLRSMLMKAKQEFGEFLIHGNREAILLEILQRENKEAFQYYKMYMEHRSLPISDFKNIDQLKEIIHSIIAHQPFFLNHLRENGEQLNLDLFYQMVTTEFLIKGKKTWYQNFVGIEAYCMSKLYEDSTKIESIRRK